jgi:hypothetical protein
MSFFTVVEIEYLDESIKIDIASKKDEVLSILTNDGVHSDVLTDLQLLFEEQKSEFNLHPVYCFELIEKMSTIFPEVSFSSRGLGEEYIFTWVSLFENGITSFKNLAWENENPFL